MDVAELYLSLIRPSAVPVVGECVAEGFIGQVQIERWNWNLMNDDEIKRADQDQKDYDHHAEFLTKQPSAALRKKLMELQNAKSIADRQESHRSARETYKKSQAELKAKPDSAQNRKALEKLEKDYDDKLQSLLDEDYKADKRFELEFTGLSRDLSREERKSLADLDKQVGKAGDQIKELTDKISKSDEDYAKHNKSYEFSFSKRVDFATTQMLNSMKSGDVFPVAILTINQRSSNAGMFLVFTVTNLRLLDYNLRADVSETMTDMKEQWKAEFRSLSYVYKNRRSIESSDDAVEAASKAATQGTVRTFMMKKDLGI